MSERKGKSAFGHRLLGAAREALAYQRGDLTGVPLTRRRVTARMVEVVPPPVYAGKDIRRVRERLGLSQPVFAHLLGASASTVRAWERDAREPSVMARRLIALAEREPAVFEQDIVAANGDRGD
jgi:putative transcriptional regulator